MWIGCGVISEEDASGLVNADLKEGEDRIRLNYIELD